MPVARVISSFKKLFGAPEEVTETVLRPFQRFVHNEVSSGLVLMTTTVMALIWANSAFSETYQHVRHAELSFSLGGATISKSLAHWIDEGLMAVFFFIVGLEIKREMLVGDLSSLRKALLPVSAAAGGMLVPALLYIIVNTGHPSASGWGIPMATDIAFALGALAIIGRGLPRGLRLFLSAFAIADDLGAVFVIALFYQKGLNMSFLPYVLTVLGLLALLNYFWIRRTLPYALLGIMLWTIFILMGLHATVAGIVVAMFIPAKGRYDTDRFMDEVMLIMSKFSCPPDGCGRDILLNERHLNAVQSLEIACHNVETPLQRLETALHPWVAFAIIPLFALVNAGVNLGEMDLGQAMADPITVGITMGLVIGKPVGIFTFSWLAVKLRLAALPEGVNWRHIFGVGMLGGIGFTMSLFIAGLSFTDHMLYEYSKLGILGASLISAALGMGILFWSSKGSQAVEATENS